MAVLNRKAIEEVRALATSATVVYVTVSRDTLRDLLDTLAAVQSEAQVRGSWSKSASKGERRLQEENRKLRAERREQERKDAHGRMLTGTLQRVLKRLQGLRHPWPPEVTSVVNEIEGALKP